MSTEKRIKFTGTGFQALGWTLYTTLLGFFIFPAAWGAVALYRWLIRSLSFSDESKASFVGEAKEVWAYFAISMVLGYLPLSSRFVGNANTSSYIQILITYLILPINALIAIEIIRWFFSNIRFSTAGELSFNGKYGSYLGWLVLISLSAFTIIGWAWAIVAFIRWVFRNVEGGTQKFEFLGSGGGLLWRCLVAGFASILILPIPWVWLWVVRWVIENILITQETDSEELEETSLKVFFTCSKEDADRASVVRQSCNNLRIHATGFSSFLELEELEKQGKSAIIQWLDEQLDETSVTVVLVGQNTCANELVKLAVEMSIKIGNGLIGIDISKIKDAQGNKSDRCGKIPKGYPFYLWFKDEGKINLGNWTKKVL